MAIEPAGYYSATAHIGREFITRPKGGPASYWSASADVGREPPSRNKRNAVFESSLVPRRGAISGKKSVLAAYSNQQAAGKALSSASIGVSVNVARESITINRQNAFLGQLQKSLSNLAGRLLDLGSLESFNPLKGTSTDSSAATADPTTFADKTSYEVTVDQLAVSHKVVSNEYSDTNNALNLSGSFKINGYTITVSTTDNLTDIRDMINNGEDENGNGQLDTGSEDLNGNGILDHYYQASVYIGGGVYLPSFSYSEDRDLDGVLDTGGEDANGNGAIDGGSENIMAKASVEDGRLVITSLDGGNSELRLDDTDDILENLGFYKRSTNNEKILKSSVDNSPTDKHPVFEDSQMASFTVNGKVHTSPNNIVSEAINNVSLELLKESDRTITITIETDTSNAVNNVLNFTSAYNDVIRLINNETDEKTPNLNNATLLGYINSLASDILKDVSSKKGEPNSLNDIGIGTVLSTPQSLSYAILATLSAPETANGPFREERDLEGGTVGRLAALGITGKEDFTLSADKDKLSQAIAQNPESIFDVFNTVPDGIAIRVLNRLAQALEEPFNLIESERNKIKGYETSNGNNKFDGNTASRNTIGTLESILTITDSLAA